MGLCVLYWGCSDVYICCVLDIVYHSPQYCQLYNMWNVLLSWFLEFVFIYVNKRDLYGLIAVVKRKIHCVGFEVLK
jgi:hypothetical protein